MGRTILVADDSRIIQRAVNIVFEKEAYEVITVSNGDDAVAKVKETSPSVVLADHIMPGKTGYEVAAALKADPATASIPVLIMAGGTTAYDEAKAQSAGAAGHVKKPFDSKSLLEQLNELLGGAPSEEATAAAAAAAAATAAPAANLGVPSAPQAPGTPAREAGGRELQIPKNDPFANATPAVSNIKPAVPQIDPFAAPKAPVAASPFAARVAQPAAPVASAPFSGSALGDLLEPSGPTTAAPARDAPVVQSPAPATPAPATPAPAAPAIAAAVEEKVTAQVTAAVATSGDSTSTEAISAATREIIERVVWEVVPELAETLIREEIARLMRG
ncbi:MAG: response regulator [Deltaproteobacteria bacterium]|nr:response regulator [Deltaproteobacteria bacterium]